MLLSAHIDGHDLGQSAMDNASGLAVAPEVTRALAPIVPSLPRGLRVGFFTLEERGLTGSRIYVDALFEAECDRIAVNVNLDSVAGSSWLTAELVRRACTVDGLVARHKRGEELAALVG